MKLKILFLLFIFSVSCNKEEENKPTLSKITIDLVTRNSIKCSAVISDIGSSSVTESGVCWDVNQNPSIDNNHKKSLTLNDIVCEINELEEGTIYYLKAYVVNGAGISYSEQIAASTLNSLITGAITDIDGNNYKTVLINGDFWMAEDLKVTYYSNGDIIPNITNEETWMNPIEGYRCYYGNDSITYSNKYGALYNFLAISDNRDVCPDGWHVSTKDEWNRLIDFAGGNNVAHLKMIEPNSNWKFLTGLETNETGFNALGNGGRDAGGSYSMLNVFGEWWTSDLSESFKYYAYYMDNQGVYQELKYNSAGGKAIRCVKNKD